LDINELNRQLSPQGLQVVWVGVEGSADHKMRPIPVPEQIANLEDAISTLGLITQLNPNTSMTVHQDFPTALDLDASTQLKSLFDRYGSDKATTHDYHILYSNLLLKTRTQRLNVLEIGLGTNNIDVQSNMGPEGKPGASLRAFRDFLPNSRIYGADVDDRILFEEDRIKTFKVDQLSLNSLRKLALIFKPFQFDLVIDDGLHRFISNVNTLFVTLQMINETGVIVIEDIGPELTDWWRVVGRIISPSFEMNFFIGKSSNCAVIGRSVKSWVQQC
jgi:hypothetical protein